MALEVLLYCLSIAISASFAAADSFHGCGGFVEASPALVRSRKASDAKWDYSNIMVELQTIDGLVKERTQCAPNGYYFIPVYDKGSMAIKVRGPDGWTWKPDTVPVLVDQSGCNSNADINFQFTGFTLSGSVKGAVGGRSCSSKEVGPSGVKVELLTLLDEVISSTLTAMGEYKFTNITPGTYKLQASHPNLVIEVRGSSEVELAFGNAVVDDIFFVAGYDIRGSVVAQGNSILGVHIYLYSDDTLVVNCPQGVGNAPGQKKALCHTVSDADGKFVFHSVPCGVYQLKPFYKGENTVFDVSPPSVGVAVEHRHVTLPQKFQVTGFSIGGRIIDGNGMGISSVKILVNGQYKAITDVQGFYKLDQVTSKHYSISADKEHYKFSSLDNFLVLPNLAFIDDIKAVYYDICGIVQLVSAGSKVKVALTHGPEDVKPQSKLVDESGKFCFQVLPGEYRLSALSAQPVSSPDLLFSPSYIDVKANSPLLNVEFFQSQVNVQGTVICKEDCDSTVYVSLSKLVGRAVEDKTTVSVNHADGGFLFPKVSAGKYRIEVKHGASSEVDEDDWCWDQSTIDFDVAAEDVKGILFVQKGYWISITSTHDTDSYIQYQDSARVDLSIMRGSQRICVESSGNHELHFDNPCVLFGSSSMEFNTLKPSPIFLTGMKYLVKGELYIDPIVHSETSDLAERLVLDIVTGDGKTRETILTSCDSDMRSQISYVVCKYSVWSQVGENFILVPRDSGNAYGKKILFYPQHIQVSVTKDGCQDTISPISGRFGLYLEGSVTPGLSGVNIKIFASGKGSNTPLKNGDLALTSITEDDGSFTAGPLYDDIDYMVEAYKPGYHIKKVGPYKFACQELGKILVDIKIDGKSEEHFPSILLSLSGEDGYRNNSITGTSGTFVFNDLFPGSFYLRPLLKEYSFSPATVAIELDSGESEVVVFQAARVAYSAMGTVSLLSGLPKEGVYVEARSESSGYYEEAITDYLGNFRLRGLQPHTTYVVKLASKEYPGGLSIERASPEYFTLKVETEDIRGLNFVIFEWPEFTILSGHVKGADLDNLQPHLSVEVRSAGDPSKIESVFPLPISRYFEIRDLPKGKHFVQLRSGLQSSIHMFESDVIEVHLGKQTQVHIGPLNYRIKDHQQKLEPTPAPVLPLVVGVFVIALFFCLPSLKDMIYQIASGMAPSGSPSPAATKKEVRRPVLRKRAY